MLHKLIQQSNPLAVLVTLLTGYEDTRMVPECYQEKYLRVFVRNAEKVRCYVRRLFKNFYLHARAPTKFSLLFLMTSFLDDEKAQSVKAAFEKYCAEEADSFKPSGNSTPSYINGYSPISAS